MGDWLKLSVQNGTSIYNAIDTTLVPETKQRVLPRIPILFH